MTTPENENQSNTQEKQPCEEAQPAMNASGEPAAETNIPVSPTKKFRSPVWNHFETIKVGGVRRYAKCKYCNKELTGRSKDGTNHLDEHFKRCPRRNTRDIRQHILVGEQKTAQGKAYMSKYAFDAEVSREDISTMIILHDYPLSMVEHYGFRKLLNGLQPLFKVPSRPTIKSDVIKTYESKKSQIMRILEENESRIALTSDMWTATKQKKGYMAITAHYINRNWKIENRIISFLHVKSPHTAEVLSQAMMECLLEWNIDNKLSTLTLDNCSTNDAIINKLLGTLTTSSLMLKGKIFHMRCCAHIINIIVQHGFSVIQSAIENVRDSVVYWTSSPKRVQDFRSFARQVGVECQKELLVDCKTRWNYVYMMLSVALEYKDVFIRLRKKDTQYTCLPSEDEWKMALDVCEKLKVFYHVTVKFSGTKYPTSNIFFPLICELKVSLMSWQQSQNDVIRSMAETMLIKFEKYWSVIHSVMCVGIVLDPRYKVKLINYFFPKIYGDDAIVEVVRIRNLCTELFEEYKKKYADKQGPLWKKQRTSKASEGGSSNKPSWESDFESTVFEDDVFDNTELDDYLNEKLLPNEEGFDILMWWKCNGSKFPILQRIARDVLAIPISTVASESAFSMSGNKVTKQRSRLKSETVGALMCSQSWMRKELEDKKEGESQAVYQTVDFDVDVD